MKTLDRLKTWKQVYLQVEDTENNLGLGGFFQRVTDRDLDSALLGEYTFADLNTEVTWLSGLAPIAYSVLCNRFWDKWADRTRLDLDIGFASLKDEWLASAKDELRRAFLESAEKELSGKVIPDNILQAVDQMVDERIANDYTVDSETELYVNSRFIQSALDGVSAHGCKNDVRFFRKYLNHQNPEVRLSALNGLARFGSNEDLGPILALVHDEDSRVRHLAAETAIHLAPGIDGAGPKLFDSSDPLIPGTGIKALLDTDIKSAADLVRPLLGHSEYAVRRDAFIFFKRRYSGDQLEQLLDDYISSGGYHYDVVCWLDRHLYGPDFFRKISI